MPNNIIERIRDFNRGRSPQLLEKKYHLMRQDVFSFYRGSCHLFYEDWPADSPLNNAPLTWICGDLHLENLGSYRGNNRLVYFDINDFDEAVLAPCTWDLARLLTSILVGAPALQVGEPEANALCQYCLHCYVDALGQGQVRWVETATARGIVRDLLRGLRKRKRGAFIRHHTEPEGKKLKLRVDGVRILPVARAERQTVTRVIDDWRIEQPDPDFFRVLDVAHRVVGTGSLGLEHYAVLVSGKSGARRPFLLDLKLQTSSSLEPYLRFPQPAWKTPAERVVAVQKSMQGTPPAHLRVVVAASGNSYLLRELQPVQDRVTLAGCHGKWRRLENLIGTLGQITAWDEIRSNGRQGSAIADHLIAFAQAPDWCEQLLAYARRYHRQVLADYASFCAGFDSGKLA